MFNFVNIIGEFGFKFRVPARQQRPMQKKENQSGPNRISDEGGEGEGKGWSFSFFSVWTEQFSPRRWFAALVGKAFANSNRLLLLTPCMGARFSRRGIPVAG